MSLLQPIALWIAAAAIPALLILYLLKLRRREEPIPSTLLWKRAVQDLEVNAPLQRLRRNLLLLLQLLILALAILALARPMIQTPLAGESSLVLLIDRSASMNAREADGRTRLELAKEQAIRLVRSLNRSGSRWLSLFGAAPAQTRVLVITFGASARIVSPFTTNTSELVGLIEAIEPTDEPTHIREALSLAEAYRTQTRLEQTVESAETPSTIVLLSDGSFSDERDVALHASQVKLINVAQTRDNTGITALRYQRNYEQPERLSVLLTVENFAPQPVTTDVSLYVDGRMQTVRSLKLAARHETDPQETAPAGGPQARGGAAASLSFELSAPEAAVLEARLSRRDALDADNRAWAVVPPPRRLSVLLVSQKNLFVESVLRGLPLARLDYLTPSQYENAAAETLEVDGRSLYDVVVLDKHETARLPIGNYLFLGAAPAIDSLVLGEPTGPQAFLWWNETHPVLRHAALEYVFVAEARQLTAPREAETLVEGPAGPMLVRYAKNGRQYLVLSFAVEDSNWWSKLSFGVFLYNAVRFLGGGSAGGESEVLRPGDTLRIALPADARTTRLTRPDGRQVSLAADESGVVRYADTTMVGIYRVEPGPEGREAFAVNLEDSRESEISPRTGLTIGTTRVVSGEVIRMATPEIWRWFVGAALLIVVVEWIVYNRRVMV